MDNAARADRLQAQVAGACLIVGAVLMPFSSFFEYRDGMLFWAGLTGVVSYIALVPGLLGLAGLLKHQAPRLAVIGGLLLAVGTVGGTNFSAALLFEWAEREAGTPEATLTAINAVVEGRVYPVLVIFSILFPIGLLVLAIGLARTQVAPIGIAAALGLGAIVFPVGHIAGIELITHTADLLLLVGLLWSAVRKLLPAAPQPAQAAQATT